MFKVLFINNNRFTRANRQRNSTQISPVVADSAFTSMMVQPQHEILMQSPKHINIPLRNDIEARDQQTEVPKSKFAKIRLAPIQKAPNKPIEAVDRLAAMKVHVHKLGIESEDRTDEQLKQLITPTSASSKQTFQFQVSQSNK